MIGAILSGDPAPMAVRPSRLERLVRRCLAKGPEDRYQSMRDVVLDLRTPTEEVATAAARPWGWMAASVQMKPEEVRVGRAAPLFRYPYAIFQVSRDGQRFLVYVPEGGQQPDLPMAVRLNWAAGLGK